MQCAFQCSATDSWLHGQYLPPGGDWHLDGFISNGGQPDGSDSRNSFVHNTIACDNPADGSGGCSGNIGLFADFAPLNGFTFDHNLFPASPGGSYCFYGGSASNKPFGGQTSHIVVVNNVFARGRNGRCGTAGPVAAFDATRPGNVWRNNTWDDGAPLT